MPAQTIAGRLGARLLVLPLVAVGALAASPAWAAATLSVAPATWDVVGLDSNDPSVGPNHFPIGARVCNTGDAAATNIGAAFEWDTTDAYINLRPNTNSTLAVATLAAGDCIDFYFEIELTRSTSAYGHKARYYIEITSTVPGTTLTTPRPREIYIERLVSQARNSVSDVLVGDSTATLSSVPPGGTMTLLVGKTYYVRLVGATATQGYEQEESFITLPNTIFQLLSVATTYTADTSPYVENPSNLPYGDACSWENDPNSPNIRACNSVGKVGGAITVTYRVRILGVGFTNPEPMSTLIYDFSGSSYHYNSDYSVASRSVFVLDPSAIGFSKTFTADAITPSGTSTMSIRIVNPGTSTITGVRFSETLPTSPGSMVIAAAPNASTVGCGLPTFAPTAGSGSLSFSGGAIAPGGTCTIKVNVTAPTIGAYMSTTDNLYIDDVIDTGRTAAASLNVATTVVACANGTMARWTVPVGTTANPPDLAGGLPTTKAGNVATATLSALIPGSTGIVTSGGQGDTTSWRTYGYRNDGQYINIVLDTKNYANVSMSFYVANVGDSNGPTKLVASYDAGAGFTDILTVNNPAATFTEQVIDFTGLTSTAGNTTIKILATGANTDGLGGSLHYDNLTFTGCSYTPPPSLAKSFSTNPIKLGTDVSRLTFAVTNTAVTPYNAQFLTGVTFTDTMPVGLVIATPPNVSNSCADGSVTAVPDMRFISLIGASLAAGASCSVAVDVKGTTAGIFDNATGYIDANESDANKGASGYGAASLTVIAPPNLSLALDDTPILSSSSTTLTFTLVSPNPSTTLTGVAVSSTLPAGVTVATSSSSACGGTLTTTAPSIVALSGGSLGSLASCTFSVTVSGDTAGTKSIAAGPVTSTNGGAGNSANITLVVKNPVRAISLLKQIGPTAIGPWSTFRAVTVGSGVYYRFVVENLGDVPLSTVTVTDDTLALTCPAWPNLPVADAADEDHIATCVMGPITTLSGNRVNVATAHGWYAGVEATDTSTATYASAALTLTKSASESSFAGAGTTLHYNYEVANSGAAALVGPVTVVDDKTAVSCPTVTTVGDNDNFFEASESITCTATHTVTAADVIAGFITNTARATVAGFDSNTSAKTVNASSCTQPTNPANGAYAACNPTASGGTCTLTCSAGYTKTANATCTAGSWSTESCNPDSCTSQPTNPANGAYAACNPTASGGTCTLTCSAGYTKTANATCTAGFWSTESCNPDSCTSQPTNPANGAYAACNPTASGGTCTLTCATGYAASGDARCTAGVWTREVCTPACNFNSDCAAPRPVCDLPVHTCVECLTNADCTAGLCNTVENTCIQGCTSDANCAGAKPHCNITDNLCVECLLSSDCAAGVCEPATNTCVECVLPGSCPVGTECDPGTHTCVPTGCTAVNTCVAPAAVCDPAGDVCVACLSDSDCGLPAPMCDTSVGGCVECLENADCGGANPFCDVAARRCVVCLSDADCAGEVCHPTANMCVECTGDGDCAGGVCEFVTFTCDNLSVCGNTIVEVGEGCDDGNALSGDGCSASCLIELERPCLTSVACASGFCDTADGTCRCDSAADCPAGLLCATVPNPNLCVAPGCGNTILEVGEGCDDGNRAAGDGCAAACLVESGDPCGAATPGLIGAPSCASGICDTAAGSPGTCVEKDSDRDGISDLIDLDDDNDGILDTTEGNGVTDTDGDGVPDALDLDSDSDGLTDVIEAFPDQRDDDVDSRIDCPSGFGANGFCDDFETTPDSGVPDYDRDGVADGAPEDTDGDGVPDYRDLDTDDDGILDAVEAGHHLGDPNGDGLMDCLSGVGLNGLCDDLETLPDSDQSDFDGDGTKDGEPRDTDDDGVHDFRDLDADNDGLTDLKEGGSGCTDAGEDGVCDGGDGDGDGIIDEIDRAPGSFGTAGAPTPPDSDRDGTPDLHDPDSDNDGLPDADEPGRGTDPSNPDSDGGGMGDGEEVLQGRDPLEPNDDDIGVMGGRFFGCQAGGGGSLLGIGAGLWLMLRRMIRKRAGREGSHE